MLATAAAAHLALASAPKYTELYGTDGIVADPTPGHVYESGRSSCPRGRAWRRAGRGRLEPAFERAA